MLHKLLDKFAPMDAEEEAALAQIRQFLAMTKNAYDRSNLVAHVVADAWIVNPSRSHVIMVEHKLNQHWMAPGGHCDGSEDVMAAALREAAPDDRARSFVTELAVEPLQVAGEPDEKYADVILARVGELAVGRQIAAIKARLQRMNPEEDQAGYGRMLGELVALEQRRKWLLDRATGA